MLFSSSDRMRNISVRRLDRIAMEDSAIEFVERKGVGHPDSLIDGIVEKASQDLSREYLRRAGIILHHNVDKGLIIGGASMASFGSGRITRRIEVIVTGRATDRFDGKSIDINEIAVNAAAEYLKKHTHNLDVDNEVTIHSKIANGSAGLRNLFMRSSGVPLANDTSIGVGFAPFSTVERIVFETEHYLNSEAYKRRIPAVGDDIKVMGLKDGSKIALTLAIAFVAKYVRSIEEYASFKERIEKDVISFAGKFTDREVSVFINNGDSIERKEVYLTKSGLSCEAGDDGSVGRGNRVNGLITPFRYMSLEAAAGKNPVSHVGKIYNILATKLASSIIEDVPSIKECHIAMLSQIGRPIDDPKSLSISLIVGKNAEFDAAAKKARYLAESALENTGQLTSEIVLGKYSVF